MWLDRAAVNALLPGGKGGGDPVRAAHRQRGLTLRAYDGRALIEPRALRGPVPAVSELLHSAELRTVQASPCAQPPTRRLAGASDPHAAEHALIDLPRIESDAVGGTGQPAIPDRCLGEEVEVDRAAERLRSPSHQGKSPRIGILPRMAVVRRVWQLGRELPRIIKIALDPVRLHRDQPGSRSCRKRGVRRRAQGAKRTGRDLRTAGDLVSRRAGDDLDGAAQRPRPELRAKDTPAHHQPIEQRGRQGGKVDRAAAGTLQRNAVE